MNEPALNRIPNLMSRLSTGLSPRDWVSATRRRGAYWAGLGVVVLAYLISLGGLLVSTQGLPYVLDNNETYSSLVHARNILRFGVRETFGLTDEAYGQEATQHPYVYTHGGNFPRIYTLLLYVLGARTAEAQIVITTFTVGLTGLLLAYHFFSRVANPLFALIYCLFLITDYVMQTQWLVNTWRAWHPFFLFSSLLCVHGLLRRGRLPRWRAAITLLNFACLIYFEIVFATLVTVSAMVYAGLLGRRRPRRVLQGWLLIGGGAALGAAVLIGQLIGYLGWDGFREDVRLTYLARNAAAVDLNAFRSAVWSFVEEHRLVFWDNFFGGVVSNTVLFRWCLLPYTPALVFIALLISTGWAVSLLPVFDLVIASKGSSRTWSARSAMRWAIGAGALFVYATMMDSSFAGLPDKGLVGRIGAVIAAAAVGGLGLTVHHRLRERTGDGLGFPTSRIVGAAVVLLVFAALARSHPFLYDDGVALAPLFRQLIGRTGGVMIWRLAVLGGAVLAVSLVVARHSLMSRDRRRFERLILFVIAGMVGLVTVLSLFPGYVMSGYLSRYCPLTVYLHLVPFAVTFYVLVQVSLNSVKGLAAFSAAMPRTTHSSQERIAGRAPPRMALWLHPVLVCRRAAAALPVVLVLADAAGKLDLQAWMRAQPCSRSCRSRSTRGLRSSSTPTRRPSPSPPRDGRISIRSWARASFATWTASSISAVTFRYLWLADKRSNTKYFEPDYFVCWSPRQLFDPVVRRAQCQDLQDGGRSARRNEPPRASRGFARRKRARCVVDHQVELDLSSRIRQEDPVGRPPIPKDAGHALVVLRQGGGRTRCGSDEWSEPTRCLTQRSVSHLD